MDVKPWEITGVLCPYCKRAPLILRRNHTTGKPFWGCNRWPECDGTMRLSTAEQELLSFLDA